MLFVNSSTAVCVGSIGNSTLNKEHVQLEDRATNDCASKLSSPETSSLRMAHVHPCYFTAIKLLAGLILTRLESLALPEGDEFTPGRMSGLSALPCCSQNGDMLLYIPSCCRMEKLNRMVGFTPNSTVVGGSAFISGCAA